MHWTLSVATAPFTYVIFPVTTTLCQQAFRAIPSIFRGGVSAVSYAVPWAWQGTKQVVGGVFSVGSWGVPKLASGARAVIPSVGNGLYNISAWGGQSLLSTQLAWIVPVVILGGLLLYPPTSMVVLKGISLMLQGLVKSVGVLLKGAGIAAKALLEIAKALGHGLKAFAHAMKALSDPLQKIMKGVMKGVNFLVKPFILMLNLMFVLGVLLGEIIGLVHLPRAMLSRRPARNVDEVRLSQHISQLLRFERAFNEIDFSEARHEDVRAMSQFQNMENVLLNSSFLEHLDRVRRNLNDSDRQDRERDISLLLPAVRVFAGDELSSDENDLRNIANDRESGERRLDEQQEGLVAVLKSTYRDKLERIGGVNAALTDYKCYLAQKIQENPVRDANGHVLPLRYNARLASQEPYYQHAYHTAWRMLQRPNPWISPQAHFVSDLGNGRRAISITTENKELLAYAWLAVSDETVQPVDGFSQASMIDAFINYMALIGRRHNWDQTRPIPGTDEMEEYDDLEGDKPPCSMGDTLAFVPSVSSEVRQNLLKR